MEFGNLIFRDVRGKSLVGAKGFAREGFKFLEAGEFVQIAEAEAHQEFFRSAVQDGAADDFFASGGGDQLFVEKRVDDAGSVDAANFLNFGSGDGLLVGDDRESLERRHRETKRRAKDLMKRRTTSWCCGLVYIL